MSEFEQGRGFVGLTAVRRASHSGNRAHLSGEQTVDEIQIVNHEVEHDAYVGAAARPWTHSPAIHFPGSFRDVEQTGMGEYKALLMADGQNPARAGGERYQFIGVIEVGGDRLFDQHMRAGIEESPNDGRMRDRRRADAYEVDVTQEIAPVGNRAHALDNLKLAADIGADVCNGRELDTR